jgi:hypothetical protein
MSGLSELITSVDPTWKQVYKGFKFEELREAFNLVKNKKDWRLGVDEVSVPTNLADVVIASIEYFTGSWVKRDEKVSRSETRLTFAGYSHWRSKNEYMKDTHQEKGSRRDRQRKDHANSGTQIGGFARTTASTT